MNNNNMAYGIDKISKNLKVYVPTINRFQLKIFSIELSICQQFSKFKLSLLIENSRQQTRLNPSLKSIIPSPSPPQYLKVGVKAVQTQCTEVSEYWKNLSSRQASKALFQIRWRYLDGQAGCFVLGGQVGSSAITQEGLLLE